MAIIGFGRMRGFIENRLSVLTDVIPEGIGIVRCAVIGDGDLVGGLIVDAIIGIVREVT